MHVTDEMVNRFLTWYLPWDFAPDGGVSFAPVNHLTSWPVGTNLLTAAQARQMLEHVFGGTPKGLVRGLDGVDRPDPAHGAHHPPPGHRPWG